MIKKKVSTPAAVRQDVFFFLYTTWDINLLLLVQTNIYPLDPCNNNFRRPRSTGRRDR